VARLAVVGLLLGTAAVTLFSAHVSQLNYPGGAVWETLETLSIPENSKIHFPSYPLQTGASLFTFVHAKVPLGIVLPRQSLPAWEYVKDEDPALLTPAGAWDAGMDYVVTPDWTRFVDSAKWTEVAAIDAYAGVRRGGKLGLYVAQDKKLAILQRVD
jgi:alpha-1,6-mannosyltransferase